MQKLQARNIPDELYDRISAAAVRNDRSLEGEVRHTLAATYPAPGSEILTLRQKWQQETAQRLRQLTFQLKADKFWQFRGPGTMVQLARHVGEQSPAHFLDWMDGSKPLSYEAAGRIAAFTGCSDDWLLDGRGDPFPLTEIGSPADYEDFFSKEERGDCRFHMIRFADGDLLCLRHDRSAQVWSAGYMGGRFYLKDGMGGGGMGNLKRFLQYLKKHRSHLRTDSYDSREKGGDHSLHHPCYLLNTPGLAQTDWLQQLLEGKLPDSWAADAAELRYMLNEVRDTAEDRTT